MADPFVGEIRMFGFNFAPTGWAQCNGQLLPLSQNTALFSLLGTFYGGDGKSTFALPNLQSSAAMHWGQGSGLSQYESVGISGGTPHVTLLQSEIPVHAHTFNAVPALAGNVSAPSPSVSLSRTNGGAGYRAVDNLVAMDLSAISPTGSSLPHNNLMPYLTVNFCIALQGVYPLRS
jgi:microcystin-dependent protein